MSESAHDRAGQLREAGQHALGVSHVEAADVTSEDPRFDAPALEVVVTPESRGVPAAVFERLATYGVRIESVMARGSPTGRYYVIVGL